MQLPDFVLPLLLLVPKHPLHQLAGFVPEVVVAHVHPHLAKVNVHNMGADGVKKVTVVGDYNEGAGEFQQKILQPGDGADIQVVGGLVQQDDVRVAEEGLGQ